MPHGTHATLVERASLRTLFWIPVAFFATLAMPMTGRTAPGDTEVVSVNDGAVVPAECGSSGKPHQCVSGDGRYVVFQTESSLVAGDTNGTYDIYVRDRALDETRLLSVIPDGSAAGNAASQQPAISTDGRFVAFQSNASDLVPGDTNASPDIFVRDLVSGVTERVSLTATGTQGSGSWVGYDPFISANGRFVVFVSSAALLPGATLHGEVLIRDRIAATTQRVTVRSDGVPPDGGSRFPSISDDGRFVAFLSFASNLVLDDKYGDQGALPAILIRDMQTGAIERVSTRAMVGVISGNGRYVAFSSSIPLVPDDTNKETDVYVWDRLLRTTEQVSLALNGSQLLVASDEPAISADGRFVAFDSLSSGLVKGDTNGYSDSFVRDRLNETIERVSVATSGLEQNRYSQSPSLSADGTVVSFWSDSTNLGTAVPGAYFVHQTGGPRITSYALQPSSLSFGDQTITTGRKLSVTILNTGTVPIWVGSVNVSGPAAAEFQLSNVCHGWVQPTLRCRTSVTFKPASVGSKVAMFSVTAAGVSQSVPLGGTGVLASYTASPTSLAFGAVSVGSTSARKAVTITNTGASVLPLKYVALVGTDARQFRRDSLCPENIAARGSCIVRLRFVPTTVGAHEATLSLWAAGGAGKNTVALTGTGQ